MKVIMKWDKTDTLRLMEAKDVTVIRSERKAVIDNDTAIYYHRCRILDVKSESNDIYIVLYMDDMDGNNEEVKDDGNR